MPTVAHRACALSVWGLAVALIAGCSSFPSVPFFGREEPDVVPGVVPPGERVTELRKLREEAGKTTAEQKEQVAARLAGQIAQETDASLRAEIVRTLAAYPTDQGRRIMRHAMEDRDRQVRIAACEAWGQLRDSEAVRLLGEALSDDSDIDVRLAAAKALGKTGHPEAAAALAPALADSDPAMQYRATLSLRQATGKDMGTVAAWRRHLNQAYTPEARPSAVAERPHSMH
ncbi:MAG: HEAT repeat domain-containing protein [Thermoguttaceae bacterium]|nr:HEAT repeat domain-containing protein [Thermoguttaceae bacterium]